MKLFSPQRLQASTLLTEQDHGLILRGLTRAFGRPNKVVGAEDAYGFSVIYKDLIFGEQELRTLSLLTKERFGVSITSVGAQGVKVTVFKEFNA